MPCEFRLLQLGGEAFSLDIPLYRITGRPDDGNGDYRPFGPLWLLQTPVALPNAGSGDSWLRVKPAICCDNPIPRPSRR